MHHSGADSASLATYQMLISSDFTEGVALEDCLCVRWSMRQVWSLARNHKAPVAQEIAMPEPPTSLHKLMRVHASKGLPMLNYWMTSAFDHVESVSASCHVYECERP